MTDEEAMLIEHACSRLQARYCILADRGDVEGFTALFTPDASITVPDAPSFCGQAAIGASMRMLASLGVTMRHLMTNSVVEVTGPDSAVGVCYLTVFNSAEPPDAGGCRPSDIPSTVGEYADEFRRTQGGWRFSSRTLKRVFRRADDPVRKAAQAAQGG